MEYILIQFVNGLCQGSIYALMAIGYASIVGVTGLVTFAYGEVMMIGAFAAYYTFQYFADQLLVGILASFAAAACMGFLVYKICYERFFDKPRHISLICTIGFSMLVKNLAQILFGANTKAMPSVIQNFFLDIGPVRINAVQLIIVATVIGLSGALYLLFNKTQAGIRLRAVNQSRQAAALVGINVKRTILFGNCLGCGIGGTAGMLLAIYYQSLSPTIGSTFGNKAFASAVAGGMTSIPWAAGGGVLIGVIENIGTAFLPNSYRDVFAFVFLFIVLLLRPEGLSKKEGIRP